ncbi:MAG: hypothetical protein AB8B48_11360 [Pseudomonadales bacterium]
MTDYSSISDNTPVLIGSGQVVQREATASAPMELAALASSAALEDSGAANIAAHIDTICVTKLFSDMGRRWNSPWGRSNNPPQSVAKRIRANPNSRVYTETGGNGPQSRVIEFARDIALGERSVVLLTGAEALKNQRHAERNGVELNWNEEFDEPLEDRGFGDDVATSQEGQNGLINIAYYYTMVDQAVRAKHGRSIEEHRAACARLMASLSAVAANNPNAQFAGQQSEQEILAAANLTHLYTKRMIAQDGVNQAAALLMCSAGKARELGIDPSRWVFMHGMAEGKELMFSHRDDPSLSPMAGRVAERALNMAQKNVEDIGAIDIYSCFPCAVSTVAEQLGLPADGSRPLTITGGLPYFGGPGNNYGMHALAESVQWARANKEAYALVTSNGGMLSKHASGVYSQQPSSVDWANVRCELSANDSDQRSIISDPHAGHVVTYSVNFTGKNGTQAIALGETANGERFVCCTAPDDHHTAEQLLETDIDRLAIAVTAAKGETLHFTLNN